MSDLFETLISVDQLAAHIDDPQFVIIDCRFSLADTTQGETHYQESRIPGARYAHLDKHLSSPIIAGVTGRHPLPDKQALAKQFQQWGINTDSQIVAYDDKSGAIASRLWWLSHWLGHKACAVVDGGFNQWKRSGKEIETSNATIADTGNFQMSESLFTVVEKTQVLDAGNCLVDAREPERYRGEHEPIDPVAGHIPGAINIPFMGNVDANGLFLEATTLAQRFNNLLASRKNTQTDTQLVHYCGSGVTAAHNMLAMAHAKLEPGALYAGSFSEWVATKDADQFPVAPLDD